MLSLQVAPPSVPLSDKHSQAGPWSDNTDKSSVLDAQPEESDEFNLSGENMRTHHVSPINTNFGPIGPPMRPVAKPSSTPPIQHSSPQKAGMQTPPVTKSPLLGPAPHGLLPPPQPSVEKGQHNHHVSVILEVTFYTYFKIAKFAVYSSLNNESNLTRHINMCIVIFSFYSKVYNS